MFPCKERYNVIQTIKGGVAAVRLTIRSCMHFLVDGVCAAALFRFCRERADFSVLLLLYNTLAFSTQCLVGLLTDRLRRHRVLCAAAGAAVALGWILPLPGLPRVILIGLGNSLFHVEGGTQTLLASGERAWPLGVFVAPGAVGLVLGRLHPSLGLWFSLLLLVLSALELLIGEDPERAPVVCKAPERPYLFCGALLLAVAVRALGGSAASFPWQTGALTAILTAIVVCAGKMAGGFVMDRVGVKTSALLSIVPAAILIAFFQKSMPLSLLGQFLLNLSMPVTLLLLYRLLPDAPGFSFGLAASALWPGTLAGQLLPMQGTVSVVYILLSFLLGLAAIWFTASRLSKGGIT